MTPPLVSIIIPAYNASRWLPAAIDSALAQTYAHREIIVIDDGSKDDSLAVASGYTGRGVQVYAQFNRGAARARNHGLAVSRGAYVQFLDADDVLAPTKLELQLARLATAPAGSVASCAWTRFTGNPAAAVFQPEPAWRDLSGLDFLCLHYEGGWMMPPIAWLAPRALLNAAGPWREDLTLNDDGEYFCRVLLRSAGIVFCPGACAYYRSNVPGSLSRRKDRAALQSLARSIESNTNEILAAEDSPRTRRAAANAWIRLAHEIFPELPLEAKSAELQARALGGSPLRIEGGRLVRWTDRLCGWRAAARLKHRQG
jgi:glycosyltransferase involved in cell wall biosynthesis